MMKEIMGFTVSRTITYIIYVCKRWHKVKINIDTNHIISVNEGIDSWEVHVALIV